MVWSPDGGSLAFASRRSGNPDLWRVDLSGGPPQQLTRDPHGAWIKSWESDLIYYVIGGGADPAQRAEMWAIPSDGGSGHKVHDMLFNSGTGGTITASGLVVEASSAARGVQLWRPPDGIPTRLTSGQDIHPALSPNGQQVAFRRVFTNLEFDLWQADVSRLLGQEPLLP